MESDFTFKKLVASIRKIHRQMDAQASRSINISLTLRNWAIGCYLREYEQNGEDRALYGKYLVENLAYELRASLDHCYTGRYLRLCRQFYNTYPQIRKSLISKLEISRNGKSVISEFKIEGQLNTYLSWYEENEMTEGDNPPVGLLLCTQKNHALVRYALAGMSNQLFVSRYQLELPRKEQIEQLIQEQMEELGYGE